MFKAFGTFLHRTPWWGLILGGIVTLILLAMFAIPVQVIRLAESGDSPEMKRAIQREIDSAFGDSALGLAEGVVKALQKNTSDPARRAELDRAQEEIARAREEILSAQGSNKEDIKDAARDAAAMAIETVRNATEATYEAAVERRVAIEEARAEVQKALKSAGIGGEEALRTVDEQLRSAKDQEEAAKAALATLIDPPKPATGSGKKPKGMVFGPKGLEISLGSDKKSPTPPSSPSVPDAPPAPAPPDASKVAINLDLDPLDSPLPPLPPELRREIHERVATDVRRIGVGGALIAAFIPLFFMTMVAKYFIGRSRRAQAFAEVKQKEAETQSAGRQIMEARLQALQAQVEPHFLYNTLANVQALTEVDPPAANKMVGHLIEYLRAALPKMRETSSTIGQEIELARAYLNILKMRMGPRLDFAINVPMELMTMPFPPLMLPSLVENAIKHGLEPVREGGRVDVTAELIGDRLRISVRDTGRGLNGDADGGLGRAAAKGGGVGLSNIRERLSALYGDAGRFTLESNQPTEADASTRGVTATIELPANGAAQFTPGGSNAPLGIGSFAANVPEPPKTWWRRTARIAGATHNAWAKAMSFTLIGIMIVLAILFGLALAGMVTGWLPVQWGGTEMKGIDGLALGTIVLLFIFGILAIVAMLVVALIYGVGIFAVGVVIFALLVALISAFPALAPFVLVGLFFYWIFFRRKKKAIK